MFLLGPKGALLGGALKAAVFISAETFFYSPSYKENDNFYRNYKEKLNDTVKQMKSSRNSQIFDVVSQSNKLISDIFKGKSNNQQDR
jgi:hypothetical protein